MHHSQSVIGRYSTIAVMVCLKCNLYESPIVHLLVNVYFKHHCFKVTDISIIVQIHGFMECRVVNIECFLQHYVRFWPIPSISSVGIVNADMHGCVLSVTLIHCVPEQYSVVHANLSARSTICRFNAPYKILEADFIVHSVIFG